MPKFIEQHFKEREAKVLELLRTSGISYLEIGVYGSYARGDYKGTSDIDVCVIVEEHPDRHISGEIRSDAEELGADIIYVTSKYFQTDTSLFAANLRRDYRRIS